MMNGQFNPFGGITLHEDPTMVVKVVRRVPGGYLNRWLIRAEVIEPSPCAHVIHGRMYAHPVVIARIKAELSRGVQHGTR